MLLLSKFTCTSKPKFWVNSCHLILSNEFVKQLKTLYISRQKWRSSFRCPGTVGVKADPKRIYELGESDNYLRKFLPFCLRIFNILSTKYNSLLNIHFSAPLDSPCTPPSATVTLPPVSYVSVETFNFAYVAKQLSNIS